MTVYELVRSGGSWLGAVRSWMQRNKHNGDKVIWGSNDLLSPPMTVAQVEEAAAEAVAAHSKEMERQNRLLREDLIAARQAFQDLSKMSTDPQVVSLAQDHWFKLFQKNLG